MDVEFKYIRKLISRIRRSENIKIMHQIVEFTFQKVLLNFSFLYLTVYNKLFIYFLNAIKPVINFP